MSNKVISCENLKNRMMNMFLLFLLLASMLFVFSLIDKNIIQICITFIILLGCTMWGHVAVYPLYYRNNEFLNGFVWGCVSGLAIASLIISIIVFLIDWNVTVIFILITAIPAILLILLWSRKKIPSALHVTDQFTLTLILAAMIIVTVFYIYPFKNLGTLVGDQYVYAWLFGHDFINRMVHVESLSRGIPLISMVFQGETLSYYWLSYVFPSLLLNLKFISLEIQQLLQVTLFFYSLLTTIALILFLRKYIQEKAVFFLSMVLVFCCYSYVWILNTGRDALIWLSQNYLTFIPAKVLMDFSGFSHGVYRFFLVEPQGVFFIPIMLMIFTLYAPRANIYAFILTGILLGLSFGVEATNGIMLMLWFGGISFFYFIVMKNERTQVFFKHFVAVSCALLVYTILFSIEMYSLSTGQGALQLSPNWFALKTGIVYFPLAYGPPFILGFAGLILLLKKREPCDHWVYSFVLLFGIAFFFVFFIQNPTEYHFGLLKATRVIPICLVMLSVYFLQSHLSDKRFGMSMILLIAISLPTLITDNKIASDIKNPSTFVRMSDMEAARWIKMNLPKDAVVQSEPNYPGPDEMGDWNFYAYSFIPNFAQRITAIGEWKVSSQAHESPDKVAERFHDIKRMYLTTNVYECMNILKKYEVDYVYIGELEQKLYAEGISKFENNPEFFTSVFSTQFSEIFKIVKGQ